MCSVRTNYDKVGALINNGFEAAKRYGAQANGQSSGSRAQKPKTQKPETKPETNEWRMENVDQGPETRDQRPEPDDEPSHAHTPRVTAPACLILY